MKLLICTQAVDENDPILGFFCRWIGELATRFERVEIICLREGAHHLPPNVRIHTLGLTGTLARAYRLKHLAWELRMDYDVVFVHMNPEYLAVAGGLWKFLGKKVTFWYNHPAKNFRLDFGALFADRIFYTSPYAATARMRSAEQMPVGIDTELFKPANAPRDRRALYLQGRVMPSKHIELALAALRILRGKVPGVTLDIVGPQDAQYVAELTTRFRDLIESGVVQFLGPKKNRETPALYAAHAIALNLAAAGHFDKSAFEAMACETPVVVTSEAFAGIVPDEWIVREGGADALASKLERLLALPESEYRALGAAERASVVKKHSLVALIDALVKELYPASMPLTNAYAKEYYDAQVGPLSSYEDQRWHTTSVQEFEYRQTKRALLAALGGRSYANAIEIGPGDGVWTPLIKAHVKGRLYLVEQSAEMLARARAKLSGIEGILFERADFMESHPPAGAELIIAVRSFEYFEDKAAALAKMRSLLAPGGRIVIITKNPRLFTSTPAQGKRLHSGQVTPEELARLCTDADLAVLARFPAVVRWKAKYPPARFFFESFQRIALATHGRIKAPTYAVESYAYIIAHA